MAWSHVWSSVVIDHYVFLFYLPLSCFDASVIEDLIKRVEKAYHG